MQQVFAVFYDAYAALARDVEWESMQVLFVECVNGSKS